MNIKTLLIVLSTLFLGLFIVDYNNNVDTTTANAVVAVEDNLCPQSNSSKSETTIPFFAILLGKSASRKMVDCMYWFVRASERIFNYTGEMIKSSRFRVVDFVKRIVKLIVLALATLRQNKLGLLLALGLTLLYISMPIDVNDAAITASVAVGGATCKSSSERKGESMKTRLKAMDHLDRLISLLFNKPSYKEGDLEYDPQMFVDYSSICDGDSTAGTMEIPVLTLKFAKSGKTFPVPLKVKTGNVDGGKEVVEDLILDKRCVASASDFPFETLEYFSVPIPATDDPKHETIMLKIGQWLHASGRTVFGSIKLDSKGRTKFYALKLSEAKKYADHCGQLMPYFHKLLTDCEAVEFANVKVVNPASFDTDGNVLTDNDLAPYGVCNFNDGAGIGRPSLAPKDGLVRQIQAIPVSCVSGTEKVPVAKGLLDFGLFYSDVDWELAFGPNVDYVIFRGDMIKTFSKLADDGLWVVGHTWMTGKSIDYPFHWEVTQFHGNPEELNKILEPIARKALNDLFNQVSTKEGMIEYVSAKIHDLVDRGEDVKVQMKVIGMLMSNATSRFAWTKKQLSSMLLSDIFSITKSSGVFGEGIPCLTNNLLSQVDPRYISKEVTRALGADNDGDYIVRLVNKKLGKMLFWRFPVVSGPVIVDIPNDLMNELEDLHPEVVKSFDKYGFNLEFSRDDIMKTRNTKPLSDCWETMEEIIEGEGIGKNTMLLRRLLSGYVDAVKGLDVLGRSPNQFLADAKDAACLVEMGAIALKYEVHGLNSIFPPKGLSKIYPLTYAGIYAPTKWEAIPKMVDKLGSGIVEWDSKRYSFSLDLAATLFDSWMKDVVSPKAMRKYIDLSRVNITQGKIDIAAGALSRIGMSLMSAYKRYDADSDELKAALSSIIKAAESYGARLDLDTLKLAIHLYYKKTKGTGAAGIHMSGNRLFEVFGKGFMYQAAEMDLDTPTVHSVLCFRKGADIPFDKIKLDKVGITLGKVMLTDLGITLPISAADALVPFGRNLQVTMVAPYKKSLRSAVVTCKEIS